jgi:hypothetical protein
MNLQPPSFFEVPPQSEDKTERAVLAKWREEVTRLNRENRVLRYFLALLVHTVCSVAVCLLGTNLKPTPVHPSLT